MYIFHMYSFNLLRNLTYNYDEEHICFDTFYKVHVVCYRINENLKYPFIEIFLKENGNSFFTSEQEFISPKRLDAYKVSCECIISNTGLSNRYQGYHCFDNNIYLLYRISHRDAQQLDDVINCTLTDIITNNKYFDISINNHLIHYFSTFKDEYSLYNIYNKTKAKHLPCILYNFIENNEHNNTYIEKYKTQYYMNNRPLLKLENSIATNIVKVRNIVFHPEYIISYNQLLTILEK